MNKEKGALCPYCFDGEVVIDNNTGDTFCNRCFKNVRLRKFDNGEKR